MWLSFYHEEWKITCSYLRVNKSVDAFFFLISMVAGVPSFLLHYSWDFHRISRINIIAIWQAWCEQEKKNARSRVRSATQCWRCQKDMIRTINSSGNDYEGTKMGTIGTICGHDWNDMWAQLEQFLLHCLWGHDGHDNRVCYAASADFRPYFEILLALTTHS